MKSKISKAVYGVIITAALVVTTAIPALAACGVSHNLENAKVDKRYVNASETSHQVEETTVGVCTECGEKVTIVHTYSEGHTPDSNGRCTACRYQVWHRP